eukprot:6625611-Pyramimonas_sp.AAC.1
MPRGSAEQLLHRTNEHFEYLRRMDISHRQSLHDASVQPYPIEISGRHPTSSRYDAWEIYEAYSETECRAVVLLAHVAFCSIVCVVNQSRCRVDWCPDVVCTRVTGIITPQLDRSGLLPTCEPDAKSYTIDQKKSLHQMARHFGR